VIPRREGNDSAGAGLGIKLNETVVSAAKFERANMLKVLGF
jgi:hypothetical protein